ncbi:hypothetical protein L1887_16162 [Cichorium endivia]|nr:hypothetical protein L1887_16162 [Cichorium endivia]
MGLHLLLFCFFWIATTDTVVGARNFTAGCSEVEGLALLKFKRSIKDDFRMLSSWVGTDCCSWEGVRCDDATGGVVGLHLRGNITRSYSCDGGYGYGYTSVLEDNNLIREDYYLVGEEHIGIWKQCHLKKLIVSDNNLGQEMIGPSTNISACPHYSLEILDLSGNGLNDSSLESLGRLTSLRILHLESNRLTGQIPKALARLRLLQVLDLSFNQLHGPIPTFLGQLIELGLSYNHLSGQIPESFGTLTGLTVLNLESNQLTGTIPASLEKLASLQVAVTIRVSRMKRGREAA